MKGEITVNGKKLAICTNALLPKKYRHIFGRDLIQDIFKYRNAQKKGEILDSEVLENLTWLMLKEAGEDVGKTVDEWLASIDDYLALYEQFGIAYTLWGLGEKTTAKPKKK